MSHGPQVQEPLPQEVHPPHGEASLPRAAAMDRAWPIVVLLMIVALGLALRMYELDRRSVWLDEFWAMAVSGGKALESGQPIGVLIEPPPPPPTSLEKAVPWWEVWHATGETTHPPLFYLSLRLWREALGESQAVSRAMAVAFSLAAIVLTYVIGRHISGRTVALWAALLMAVAVPQIVYAQQVRNYSMQLALAAAAAAVLVRIEKAGSSPLRLAALALSLAALMLTHYFSFGFAVGLLAYAALRLRGKALWHTFGAFAAAAALFALLWGPQMWQQRVEFGVSPTENNWLWDPEPGRPWRAIKQALTVPAELISPLDEETAFLGYLGAALYVLPLALWRRRPELHLPYLWLIGSVGLILLMDVTRNSTHLIHLRYSFIASPAVFLLLAGLVRPIRVMRHVLPALAAVSCALPLRTHYTEAYVDWRWPAGALAEYAQPGDAIVFVSDGGPPYQAYQSFIALSHYAGQLKGPVVIAPNHPGPAVIEELRRRRRTTWLVTGVGWVYPEQILPGAKFEARYTYNGTVDLWVMTWPEEAPATNPAP